MSDPTDLPELEELEPLTEEPQAAAGAAPSAAAAAAGQIPVAAAVVAAGPGLPPPGWNPAAGSQYYRFMVAGFIMFLGCLMPFGYEQASAMHSVDGFLYLFLAIGITWNWWGAIHGNRFAGKHLIWTLTALVPLIGNLMHCLGAFDTYGASMVDGAPESLGAFFGVIGGTFGASETAIEAQQSYRAGMEVLGVGRVVVLFGSVLMMLFLLQGVMGGAKTAKAQKQARREAASSRRKS